MNQFKKENWGSFRHLNPAIDQTCTSVGGGTVIPTGGNTLCKLSAPSSVGPVLSFPGPEEGAWAPRPPTPGRSREGKSQAGRATGTAVPARAPPRRTTRPAHAPTATRQNAHPRGCACAEVTLRLRAACGGRGGQKGSRRRKGRCGAARCGLGRVSVGPRALRPGVGPLRPAPGVSPAVGGAPWRLAGGSRGGCG